MTDLNIFLCGGLNDNVVRSELLSELEFIVLKKL